jgi:acyl dehydratase
MTEHELVVGHEIPELVKHPTIRHLVQYAGASGDFYEMHYDPDFARSVGLPGVILHGLLKSAFLAELAESWAGEDAVLTDLQVSYRGMDLVGQPLRCRGVVAEVNGSLVTLEVWTEDAAGNRTTVGRATVRREGRKR